MFGIPAPVLKTAGVVLATIVICSMFQRNVAKIPVIGGYLPQ